MKSYQGVAAETAAPFLVLLAGDYQIEVCNSDPRIERA